MSGPKCTDYELERHRREEEARRLEEARRRREEERRRREEEERRRREEEERRRREEERRRREEERKRRASLQSIGSMQGRLKDIQGEMRSILQSAEYEAETRDVSDIIGALQSDIKEIDNGIRPYSSTVLEEVLKKEKEIRNLKDQKEKNLVQYRNEQEDWRKLSGEAVSKALDELFKDAKGLMTKQEIEELERKKQQKDNIEELRAKAEEIEDYFEDLLQETENDPEMGKKIKEQYAAFQMQVQAGEYRIALDYYAMKKNTLKRLKEESLERQKAKENLELLYSDALISYETVCEMAGVTPQPAEHTEEGIRFMRQETIRVESELLAQKEVQIIRQEIASIMEELGYEVIGSREAERKGTKIRHQIFSYGNGTAIDVMESGGQITMEIVGMEDEDRMPTEKEKDFLEEKMVTFCSDFDKVEDVLKERHGIVVKKRHHKLNPSREYAKILNISNFDMKKDVEMISDRRTRPGVQGAAGAAEQGARRWQE